MDGDEGQLLDVLREIPPLIPQFLRKRRVGVAAPSEIAAELGIERSWLFTIVQFDYISGMYGQDGATLAQLRGYDPYEVIDRTSGPIAELKEKGLVLEDEEGMLTLSSAARDAIDRFQAAGIEYVSKRQPLPVEDLERLADELERASAAVKANRLFESVPGSHLRGYVAAGRYGRGSTAPMVRIEQALFELWGARDDAHTTAWREADLEGPPFDVLSHVWAGANTVEALAEALRYKQTPEDLESSLSWLAARELAERHGDEVRITPKGVLLREDVERETNRMYFDGWPFGMDEAVWVRDALRLLVDRLDWAG
ncbi:MAG: hypothetical protein WCD37_08640 [Chloroflexia bacterium]